MELREIIRTLILSDFYFTMPLRERKDLVERLVGLYCLDLHGNSPKKLAPTFQGEAGSRVSD